SCTHTHTLDSTSPSNPTIHTLSLHDALPIWQKSPHELPRGQGGDVLQQLVGQQQEGQHTEHPLPARRPQSAEQDRAPGAQKGARSEEHTSELQSRFDLVCRLLLEKKNAHTGT